MYRREHTKNISKMIETNKKYDDEDDNFISLKQIISEKIGRFKRWKIFLKHD